MRNVGTIDKAIRLVAGIGLVLLAAVPSPYQTPFGWIGLVPLGTALIGWCPAYRLLGIRTCRVPDDASRPGAASAS